MQEVKPPFYSLVKQFTPDCWLMLLLVFLMKAGQFMLLPYLALYLTRTTHASVDVVGVVVGIGSLVYGLLGPFNGYLIDKFGRRRVIIISVFFAGLVFIFFNLERTITYYFCMNMLVGVTRSAFDTAARSYKIHSMDLELRRVWFSVRFVVNNAAAGLGPVVGMFFIQKNADILFVINGALFVLLSFIILFYMKQVDDFSETLAPPSILQVFKTLLNDMKLFCIVVGATLMWLCYVQLDSMFGIYLNETFSNGLEILTWTFVVNTAGCVLLQIPMARFMTRFSENRQIIIGTMFYMLGFLIIPLVSHISALLFATLLVVFGEVILSPLVDLLVYKLAPTNMMGSYYGALALSMIGVGLAPMVGGVFYEYLSAKVLFFFCVFMFLLMGLLLRRGIKKDI
jgi:MFS family permease